MRTTKLLAATLVAAAALTACNNNDNAYDPAPVRFTAGIDAVATPETRAAGTAWGADAIGIFMTEAATTHYANKQYTTTGNGNFTAAAGNEMYYPMSGNTVSFVAYYPYDAGATLDTPIDITIGAQTNQPAFDLLYSSGATGSKAAASTPVALTFEHKLSKIVMNVTADDNVGATDEELEDMTVTIEGMNTEAEFDLSDGSLAVTADTDTDITPRTVTAGSIYDAIIMPGDYAAGAVKVVFTVGGEAFTWTLTGPQAAFAAGNEYTYAVKLSRTGVTASGTITAWNTENNDRGGVTAE